MDLKACVDILKQRSVTSHGDACPCCANEDTNSGDVEGKSIPEPEDLLGYADHSYLQAINDLFALQQLRVKSYVEFQSQFDDMMHMMTQQQNDGGRQSVEMEGGAVTTGSSMNTQFIQQSFPLWCAGMTETCSKLSRRIIQIREYLEQQKTLTSSSNNVSSSSSDTAVPITVLSSVGNHSDSVPPTFVHKKEVDSLIALITRLQMLEKEKFTVFASGCLDQFRLKSHAVKEVRVGSTTLMDAEVSLQHINAQRRALEEKISDELMELQELKTEFME